KNPHLLLDRTAPLVYYAPVTPIHLTRSGIARKGGIMNRWLRAAWLAGVIVGALALCWAPGGREAAAEDKAPPKKGDLPPDLAFVPPDAMGMVSVRLAELWEGATGKAVRARIPREMAEGVKAMEKALGVGPGQVERLTGVLDGFNAGYAVVSTVK